MFSHLLKPFFLILVCFSSAIQANTLPEKISDFVGFFDLSKAEYIYDLKEINSKFPSKLLANESLLPQTFAYPLNDIQSLYNYSRNCNVDIFYAGALQKAGEFTKALCEDKPLTQSWFARGDLIHPGGGTYAARYVKVHPQEFAKLEPYMHVLERPIASSDTLLGHLQRLDRSALNALLSGASMFINGDEFWLEKNSDYYIFPSSVWKPFLNDVGLNYSIVNISSDCLFQRGNICWVAKDQTSKLKFILVVLIGLNILLIIGWSIYRWDAKRRELKTRMLILQILTHELRTPIASLALTVEGFRREFEHLPDALYGEFRRLCEDSVRLRQLAEASKDYLQSEAEPLSTVWIPSIVLWLEDLILDLDMEVDLFVSNDVAVKLNVYWFSTCLLNLLKNAKKYGVAPITLVVETSKNHIVIKVIDQGQLSGRDWVNIKKPFVTKAGLGLGLTIVESMITRMGGKLKLIGPPTTFIMEINCETDIASR